MSDKAQFLQKAIDCYPEELLKGRIGIEGNVIGCLMKDLLLLDDSNLKSEYFITKDGRFYYEMIEFLRKQKRLTSLDELSTIQSLNEEQLDRFNNYGGWDAIVHLQDIVNTDNFDTYLDDLYRENTLCRLYDDGFNLVKPIKQNDDKLIIPIKLFRKMTAQEVLDWYDSRMSMYPLSSNSKVIEEGDINFDDDFIESCVEGNEDGISFENAGSDINGETINCLPFLSRQISGLPEGKSTYLASYSNLGKTTLWVTIIMSLVMQGRKVLIISNEEKEKDFNLRFMCWTLYKYCRYHKLRKKAIKAGNIDAEGLEKIKLARNWFNSNIKGNVKFVAVQEMDSKLNARIIRKYVLRDGYDTVLIDTLKIDFNTAGQQRTDLDVVKLSVDLNSIAMKYNLIMLCSMQLATWTQGQLFLDASALSNAKQVKEILSNLFLMRNVYPEELDSTNKKYFCHPFRMVKNEKGIWVEKPWQIDNSYVYRMLFVDKTRSGATSTDNGVAYLLAYQGDFGTFKEIAMCRPVHQTMAGSNRS